LELISLEFPRSVYGTITQTAALKLNNSKIVCLIFLEYFDSISDSIPDSIPDSISDGIFENIFDGIFDVTFWW